MDAGATFITCQLFYDNAYYVRFVEACRAAGITQPIIPGLMPVTSQQQIERIVSMSNTAFPPALFDAIEAAGGSGPDVEAIGMEWTIRQMEELLEQGAPGIHLYILNRANTATSPLLTASLKHWR